MFKTLQAFLLHKKNIYSENSISIEKNGVKLQLIKEIQISRHKAGNVKKDSHCEKGFTLDLKSKESESRLTD